MNEKLNHFDPTPPMLMGIKQQLQRAGIAEESIPRDWLRAIIAATEKWLRTTDDGLKHLAESMNFKYEHGESDREYTLIDNVERKHYDLKNSQVVFFSGALVDGHPVPVSDPFSDTIPPYELDISERERDKCDSCGIVSHCLKEIMEPYSEKLESLCNYCLTYHEHPKISGEGGINVCESCTVVKCPHNPRNKKRQG